MDTDSESFISCESNDTTSLDSDTHSIESLSNHPVVNYGPDNVLSCSSDSDLCSSLSDTDWLSCTSSSQYFEDTLLSPTPFSTSQTFSFNETQVDSISNSKKFTENQTRPFNNTFPEFAIHDTLPKRRGRPPKSFPTLTVRKNSEYESNETKNYQPTKEEVWLEIARLEQLRKAEKAARKNKIDRSLNNGAFFCNSPEVHMNIKQEEIDMQHSVITSHQNLINDPTAQQIPFQSILIPDSNFMLTGKCGEPRKRGRPKKIKLEEPKERRPIGRPRIHKLQEPKEPKRRGRPPKPKLEEDLIAKEPKKRGRPPKPKLPEDLLPKIPKKRGPKPKISFENREMLPKVLKKRGSKPTIPVGLENGEILPKVPKKLGLKPKIALENGENLSKFPKKRGSKPKITPENGEVLPKVPKKRGPKPKRNVESGEEIPFLPKKPKLILSYNSFESTTEKTMNMLQSGLIIVDVNDPRTFHIRRRGRPRIHPLGPKGPPKKRGRKKKVIDPAEMEAKLQSKIERKTARERLRQEKFERAIQERENRSKIKEMNRAMKEALRASEVKKKKRGQLNRELKFEEGEQKPPEQNVYFNNDKALKKLKRKMLLSHVPAYKCRRLLSCCYCQQWSWDLSQCANCMRSFPPDFKTLCVEEHELITQELDNDRPFFHPPPIPYYRPGKAVFCTCCFYYSSNLKQCDECNASIPAKTQRVFIDFESQLELVQNLQSWVDRYKPRKVGQNMIECPYCQRTLLRSSRRCPHCENWLPRNVTVVPEAGKPPDWPTASMIEQGVISELPDDYVPIYRENTVVMCRWCCTTVWDLNRCSNCLRKLPATSDLLPDGPCFDYVDGKPAVRPIFSPKPFPYLRPGLAVICPECNEYSKNKKMCDNCDTPLNNRVYVNVCFEQVDDPPTDAKIVSLVSRKVNDTYYVCPYCEFSIPNWRQCIHCLKYIPKFVTILPTTTYEVKENENLHKLDSIFRTKTLAILGSEKSIEQNRQPQKPKQYLNYVPRYKERGVAQCSSCLSWTWDMDRCMFCFVPVEVNGNKPLIIYPKPGTIKNIRIEKFRPKFAKAPLPYLRPGRWTLCCHCYCYTIGPPFCTECGKLLEDNPQYVNIDFNWIHFGKLELPLYSKQMPYKLRVTIDGKLALCPHCGYTTENFQKCSFCQVDIPSSVLITPENPELHSFEPLEKVIQPVVTLLALKKVPPPKHVPENLIKLPPPMQVGQVGNASFPIIYLPSETINIITSPNIPPNPSPNPNF